MLYEDPTVFFVAFENRCSIFVCSARFVAVFFALHKTRFATTTTTTTVLCGL